MTDRNERIEAWELVSLPWERALAIMIIKRAVDDWRTQIKKRIWLLWPSEPDYDGFDELRCFFRSDWCKELAPKGMPAEKMLAILEEELEQAKNLKEEKEK